MPPPGGRRTAQLRARGAPSLAAGRHPWPDSGQGPAPPHRGTEVAAGLPGLLAARPTSAPARAGTRVHTRHVALDGTKPNQQRAPRTAAAPVQAPPRRRPLRARPPARSSHGTNCLTVTRRARSHQATPPTTPGDASDHAGRRTRRGERTTTPGDPRNSLQLGTTIACRRARNEPGGPVKTPLHAKRAPRNPDTHARPARTPQIELDNCGGLRYGGGRGRAEPDPAAAVGA